MTTDKTETPETTKTDDACDCGGGRTGTVQTEYGLFTAGKSEKDGQFYYWVGMKDNWHANNPWGGHRETFLTITPAQARAMIAALEPIAAEK